MEWGGQSFSSVSLRNRFLENERKRDFRVVVFFLPSILTHLIEISCPIFPEIWKPAPLQAVFPQGPTQEKLLSAFICFFCCFFSLFFFALGAWFYLFIYLLIGSEELFDEIVVNCVWGDAVHVLIPLLLEIPLFTVDFCLFCFPNLPNSQIAKTSTVNSCWSMLKTPLLNCFQPVAECPGLSAFFHDLKLWFNMM